ncbi:hypothetical protein NIES267_05610 [Calothrix parasitica NIES-267]|uniref:Uncharacterized protein n=1 Tax=Calothrix parasitica NIES-267 TaxID=1973488 RepID=A0A1Z4LIN9_9CYAN|nr:hypothetical protein NIES267_05610 [Calothrix parasitica NIES-267]
MKSSTKKLLGTLEVFNPGNTFFWETSTQGEFNLWNLMINEGFVNPTDIELVFEHWQNIETWGTPTNPNDFRYAPPRSEREDENWNEEIENQRREYYRQLQQLLKTSLFNIQAYNLRVPKSTDNSYQRTNPDFSVSIIVAQSEDNHWCCFSPTVPNQVNYSSNRITLQNKPIQAPNPEIKSILSKLIPIEIYGYYDAGYDETYQHRIISVMGESKEEIIAIALSLSNMVEIKNLTVEYSSNHNNSRKISQFMNQCLKSRTQYEIGFWDIGYTYEVGQTPAGDWIGITSECEFEYNP